MTRIITVLEFASFRDIGKKHDEDKINENIDLAQESDLYDILGGFYFDVLKNKDELTYAELMDGSEFTYCDEDFIHRGIKALLSDYVYARHIYMINVNLTPFGAQKKFTNDSEGVERLTLKDLSKQAQIDASIKFRTIEKYILSKPELFSRYCKNKKANTGFNIQRFSKL
jgi:hypothetical protein